MKTLKALSILIRCGVKLVTITLENCQYLIAPIIDMPDLNSNLSITRKMYTFAKSVTVFLAGYSLKSYTRNNPSVH